MSWVIEGEPGEETVRLLVGQSLDEYAILPVIHCDWCEADRPHHGPFCCSCGTSTEGEP
jgi:hypothetical protein